MLKLNIDLPGLTTTGFAYTGWTTTPPTEPGFYWAVDHQGDVDCVWLSDDDQIPGAWLGVWVTGIEYPYALADFSHWMGPVPVPEPPTIDANPKLT
jgi:hypothetical protein